MAAILGVGREGELTCTSGVSEATFALACPKIENDMLAYVPLDESCESTPKSRGEARTIIGRAGALFTTAQRLFHLRKETPWPRTRELPRSLHNRALELTTRRPALQARARFTSNPTMMRPTRPSLSSSRARRSRKTQMRFLRSSRPTLTTNSIWAGSGSDGWRSSELSTCRARRVETETGADWSAQDGEGAEDEAEQLREVHRDEG